MHRHYWRDNEEIMDPRFRCFGCCHVRTGTVCLGIYNMILQAGAVFLLFFAISNPELTLNPMWTKSNSENGREVITVSDTEFEIATAEEIRIQSLSPFRTTITSSPTTISEEKSSLAKINGQPGVDVNGEFLKRRMDTGDTELTLGLLLGLFFITALMVCGAIKGRPLYILPFFCFQVFDFVSSCLTAAGHTAWLPNFHKIVRDHPDMPFRDQLLKLDDQVVALFVLVAYVMMLIAKAYFIGVVWACYQYLRRCKECNGTNWNATFGHHRDTKFYLPPAYDEALKMPSEYVPFDVPPPPPYANQAAHLV